jgi:hypothetical protein
MTGSDRQGMVEGFNELESVAADLAEALGMDPDERLAVLEWLAPAQLDELRRQMEEAGVTRNDLWAMQRIRRKTLTALPGLSGLMTRMWPQITELVGSVTVLASLTPAAVAPTARRSAAGDDASLAAVINQASFFAWAEAHAAEGRAALEAEVQRRNLDPRSLEIALSDPA